MSKVSYLIRCIAGMKLGGLFRTVGTIHEKTGKNRVVLLADIVYCGIRFGAGYHDYDLNEWYTLNGKQRKTYITRGINNAIVARCNAAEDRHLLSDKVEFNRIFEKELNRRYLDLDGGTADDFSAFLAAVRSKYIIAKPKDACCGKGVRKIDISKITDPSALFRELSEDKTTLVEECIVQHHALSAMYPHAINTLRVVSIIGRDNAPHILYAFLRVGNEGRVVDNLNAGGMAAPIDLEKGIISGVAFDKDYHYYDAHPMTGTKFIGFRIPLWKEVCDLVLSSAMKIPTLRYVGWDVSVTEDGPVFVEANEHPGHDILQMPPHTVNKIGMLPRYRQFIDI